MADATATGSGELRTPSITELISLPTPAAGGVSPDGRYVAYLVTHADWKDNRHEYRCFVHDLETGVTHTLTRTGSVQQVRWVSDDTLAVLKRDFDDDGEDGGPQLWLFVGLVGEGWQVTEHEGGVSVFEPFADGFVFKAPHPDRRKKKERKAQFGTFVHQEREDSADALFYLNLPRFRTYRERLRACSSEKDQKKLQLPVVELSAVLPEPMTIANFSVSSAGDTIFLTCRERDDLVFIDEPVCFRIRLDPETALDEQLKIDAEKDKHEEADADSDGEATANDDRTPPTDHLGELSRLALPPGATVSEVSPDGSSILVSHQLRDRKWYTQRDLFVLDVSGPASSLECDDLLDKMDLVSDGLDQDPLIVRWCKAGILVSVVESTGSVIYRLSGEAPPVKLNLGEILPSPMFEVSRAGQLAFAGASADRCTEVYTALTFTDGSVSDLSCLTNFHKGVAGYDLGTVETIRWTSKDGTEIEGVLRKPSGFDPAKRYPLAFVVHGGPSWASREWLLETDDSQYYPGVELAARGALVLKPNYRGSLGRGQGFLELNASNLGVGDLWDLEGAIDALVGQGIVDPDRVVCMGWSQGGYISAMAATHSSRFKAVSVGAGISDWYTYHVSNDVPQFTEHYLDASPFENREIYRKTAPIEALSENTAPMLIQHGENDQRVPLSNAMELFRGLQAKGVPVELFVYPGMGHPITKPRENRAVMWQNLTWFAHYLFGDDLDFFQMDES